MRVLIVTSLLLALARTAVAELPASPAPAAPAAPRASSVGVVVELRSDLGFNRLVEIQFAEGRRASLDVNDGTTIAVGASFLPLADGRLATRATAGLKLQLLHASNGSALFSAFPLELVELAYAGPLRLGVGGSVLVAPRLRGSGFLEGQTRTFGPGPGLLAEAEWIIAPRWRTGIGLRGSWTWLSGGGVSESGPSIGLVLRADFDVSR